jgi:hypothetical protein
LFNKYLDYFQPASRDSDMFANDPDEGKVIGPFMRRVREQLILIQTNSTVQPASSGGAPRRGNDSRQMRHTLNITNADMPEHSRDTTPVPWRRPTTTDDVRCNVVEPGLGLLQKRATTPQKDFLKLNIDTVTQPSPLRRSNSMSSLNDKEKKHRLGEVPK